MRNNMKLKPIFKIGLVLICIGIYSYSAVTSENGHIYNFSIDTSKPLQIETPAEIAIVGDNGEKGFRIGAKVGRGWLEEAGGQATYSFYVPYEDKYYFWVYSLWFDVCANAVFAKIDDLDRAIIGNDPIYNKWHWVRGFTAHLSKGTHKLILSNHSDHISLQNLYISNSALFVPNSLEPIFSDIFYDGFDGCDQGNYAEWKKIRGTWPTGACTETTNTYANFLTGESDSDSLIIFEGKEWTDYSLNVSMQLAELDNNQGFSSICFGVKDPNNFHELIFQNSDITDICHLQLAKRIDGKQEILSEFNTTLKTVQWHQVEIQLNTQNITVQIDDARPVVTETGYKIVGGIGFHLGGKVKTYFDDIHVRYINKPGSTY